MSTVLAVLEGVGLVLVVSLAGGLAAGAVIGFGTRSDGSHVASRGSRQGARTPMTEDDVLDLKAQTAGDELFARDNQEECE